MIKYDFDPAELKAVLKCGALATPVGNDLPGNHEKLLAMFNVLKSFAVPARLVGVSVQHSTDG